MKFGGLTMNPSKLEDWKNAVTQLNEEAGHIIADRDKLYHSMADEIKRVFGRMSIYPDNVHLSSSAHEIRVEFKAGDNLIIDPVALLELHMKFRLGHSYDRSGNFQYVLTFYPFKDE